MRTYSPKDGAKGNVIARRVRSVIYAGMLLLTACVTPQPQPWQGPANHQAWEARQLRLAALDNWRIDGRMAIAAGEEGGSGSLYWLQRGDQVNFKLDGPFGIGGFRVSGDNEWLTLQTDDGATLRSRNLEAELAWRLGYTIPLKSLRYWVRGLPAPVDDAAKLDIQVDSKGQLRELRQRGWYIRYNAYSTVEGYQLPTRLVVEGHDVRLKLAIGEWELLPAPATGSE